MEAMDDYENDILDDGGDDMVGGGKKLSESEKNEKVKYARLAYLSYEYNNVGEFDDVKRAAQVLGDGNYQVDFLISTRECLILYNENETVMSIRGSVTKEDWLLSDPMIAFGMLPQSPRFAREKKRLIKVFGKYGNRPVTLCGHSLGGSLAFQLTYKLEKLVNKTYCYNLGFSPFDMVKSGKRALSCKVFSKNSECRARKKITIYRKSFDPVSLFSVFEAKENSTKQSEINPHSVTNFTGNM